MPVTNAIDAEVAKVLAREGVRGMVPIVQASGQNLDQRELQLVPWQRSARPKGRWNLKDTPIPQDMVRRMHEGLPPIIRRTPRERYKVLIDRLVADGLKSYRAYGYPVWPKSVQDDLKALGWKEGDPRLYEQVEALARKYIEEGAQKQRAKDARKSTLDWHGHLSA